MRNQFYPFPPPAVALSWREKLRTQSRALPAAANSALLPAAGARQSTGCL